MPYKKEYHTLHCTRCGNDFEVLTPAYLRRLKDPKYGSICPTCRRIIQHEEMTPEERRQREEKRQKTRAEKRAAMTDEEKEEFARKRREKCQAKWRAKSEEELQAIHDKQSELQHNRIAAMSDERRAEIGRKVSETKRRRNQEMSEEERAARKARMQAERVVYWNSRTEEQRQAIIDRLTKNAQELWDKNGDPEKQQAIIDNLRKASDAYYASLSDEELQQRVEKLQEGNRKWRENMTDEERAKESERLSQQTQLMWDTMTEEQYNEMMQKRKESMEKRLSDPEYRAAYGKALSEGQTRHWANLSEGERAYQLRGLQEFRDSLTDEEREQRRLEQVDRWANKSPEEIAAFGEKVSKGLKQYHASLDEEGQQQLKERGQAVWNNKSEEEKEEYKQRMISRWKAYTPEEYQDAVKAQHEWITSMDALERQEHSHRVFANSDTSNMKTTNERFEKRFLESSLVNQFHFEKEQVFGDPKIAHRWDYGIYTNDTNTLVMLVDLDGAYYHADNCDYDGIHSKEERDEIRGLTVPEGVKCVIINESQFPQCFERMVKLLYVNYEEYIDDLVKEMKMMPFPEPIYPTRALVKSFENLCRLDVTSGIHSYLNTNGRTGDALIKHFHTSIYRAHRRGQLSPYEAWQNDDILRKTIENRIIYQNHINPNKILQGFNVSKTAPKVSVFSASRAKQIIAQYLSEYTQIFDPCSGFSGRMLGTISLGKQYIGQDISQIAVNESNNMLRFLREQGFMVDAEVHQADSLVTHGTYEALFTCPPYKDLEQWLDVPPNQETCDEWITACLQNYKCKRYVFVVNETTKYQAHVKCPIQNRSYMSDKDELLVVIDEDDK